MKPNLDSATLIENAMEKGARPIPSTGPEFVLSCTPATSV